MLKKVSLAFALAASLTAGSLVVDQAAPGQPMASTGVVTSHGELLRNDAQSVQKTNRQSGTSFSRELLQRPWTLD